MTAADTQRALELAHRYLSRRERTVAEMRRHLEARRCDSPSVEEALELLTEQRYLDDARYAQLFTEDKRGLEQWGDERIERALRERGIERDLIGRALNDGNGDDHADPTERQLAQARLLLERRFPCPPADRRERERALGMLLRKGYETEIALQALAEDRRCRLDAV